MTTAERITTQILPLESGDRLNRREFERRYAAMPQLKKAELVEGVVYLGSPVRVQKHGKPHSDIIGWLVTYSAATQGVMVCDNTTVRLDPDNEPQPDALLRIEETCGGRSRISEDDYIEGAPELIVEIAASSASYDLHDKKQAYCRNGVQEYIVWQVVEEQVSWFSLQDGDYVTLKPDAAGVVRSLLFPGLNLNIKALLAGNIAEVLAEVRRGITSEAHQEFARQLQQARSRS
jgi:Uma2 family endonuclease